MVRIRRLWLAPLVLPLTAAFAAPCAIMLGYDLAGLIERDQPLRLAYAFDEGPQWLTADDYLYYADVRVCCTRSRERQGMALKLSYEIDDNLMGSATPVGG